MKQSSLLLSHVAGAIIITGIMLCVYAAVQQTYRSSANDPQIQISRDLSYALSKGKSINKLLPADTIDLQQSLAVFTELFDDNGKPIQSTGLLNKQLPQPPQNVINYTKSHNENMITWQPQADVRMAMVFEKVNAGNIGYVAAGRSLKEIEIRESNLLKMIVITWIACIAVLLLHFMIQFYTIKKVNQHSKHEN